MGRVSLDLKKFKHVKSDKHTTTLKHADGHELTISHNNINPEFKAQLSALAGIPKAAQTREQADEAKHNKMAEGGDIKKRYYESDEQHQARIQHANKKREIANKASNELFGNAKTNPGKKYADGGETKVQMPPQKETAPDKPVAKEHNIPSNLNGPSNLSDAVSRLLHPMASGGAVQSGSPDMNYAEGGEAGLPCLNPNCKSHGKPHPNCRCHPNMAEGGEVVHYCRYGKAHGGMCAYYKGGEVNRKMYADPSEEISNEDAAPFQDGIPDKDLKDESPEQIENSINQMDKYGDMVSGQRSKEMATPDEAQIAAQNALNENAQSPAQPQPQQPQPQVQAIPQQQQVNAALPQNQPYQPNSTPMPAPIQEPKRAPTPSQQEAEEDKAWAHDLANGHITPKTYGDLWQNKSTPSKIAGLFGILVGGIGSGLTGQPNAAMQMMDNVIKNDLEAQKQSKTNAQNHWNLNYQHALQEAQANGMDATAEHTRESAKVLADTRTHMQANRNAYNDMAELVKKIPNNDPRKIQFMQALSAVGAQVDLMNSNLADKYQMQNTLINDKVGAPQDSTIAHPKGNAVKSKPAPQGGIQGKPVGQVPPEGDESEQANEKSQKYSILSPDANRKYKNIMSGYNPQWSPKSELINQQYTQAQQAEKILNGPKGDGIGGIHDIMDQMHAAQQNMGYWGHAHSKIQEMGAALPIVGGAAGAATQLVPNTHSEKRFNALKTTLESDLGTALQGLMTPTDIHAAVEKYAPAYQDTKKDVAFKTKQLTAVVQKALKSSMLSAAGLIK